MMAAALPDGAGPWLRLKVLGIPVPQGSTRAFVPKGWKRAIITGDNPKTKTWRQAIVEAAIPELAGRAPLEGPVELRVRFYMPRPKSAPRRVIHATKIPDLDKLVRAIGDALTTCGAWRDDAQVVELRAWKGFASGPYDHLGAGGLPRAEIEVRSA
jgi:Holliday junction resolvase RusA-like endonuclease